MMIVAGMNHIGHAVSAVSTVLNLPVRGRNAAPTLLTLAGFNPAQVEILITGFVITLLGAQLILRSAARYVPSYILVRRH